MKLFRVTLRIFTLVGIEQAYREVKARTAESASKKVSQAMGNRDHDIVAVVAV